MAECVVMGAGGGARTYQKEDLEFTATGGFLNGGKYNWWINVNFPNGATWADLLGFVSSADEDNQGGREKVKFSDTQYLEPKLSQQPQDTNPDATSFNIGSFCTNTAEVPTRAQLLRHVGIARLSV